MKNINRALALGLALALALGLCALGGCSGGGQSTGVIVAGSQEVESQTVDLRFFGFKADTLNLLAIEDTLHSFMDANPDITITYESIKGPAYWEAFDARSQSGVVDDIAMIDHDHVLAMTAENKLADLSGLATVDNFQDSIKAQFTSGDGAVYFLPTCISTYGLYMNHDLLAEYGQEIPTNWAEFSAVCDFFVSQGITPIIANNYSSLRSLIVARGMYDVYQSGDSQARIERFNRGEDDLAETLRPGFELVETMIERGWLDCQATLNTAQTSDDLACFAQGAQPFMVTGGWASPRLLDMEPGFEYAVYPFPILDDGSVLVMDANTCVSIHAGGEHVAEAMAFVEYLTEPDVMWAYCDSQSSFTPLVDGRIPSDPALAPSVDYISNGRSVIGSDFNLTIPLDSYLVECGTQMLNGLSADGATALLAEFLEQ